MKNAKYKRVVEYTYPNGDKFEGSAFEFYCVNIGVLLLMWIFYPIFWLRDGEYRGKRKVYYKRI